MFKSQSSRRVRGLIRSALFALLTALFLPLPLFAQAPATHHHYKLVDLGILPEGDTRVGHKPSPAVARWSDGQPLRSPL